MRATANLDGRQSRLATPDEQRMGAELLALTRQAAAVDEAADKIRRDLADLSRDHDVAGVGWSARWARRNDVSWKAVATEAGATPDLVAAHTRTSSSFQFRTSASVEAEG
jgi:hypothetical protein